MVQYSARTFFSLPSPLRTKIISKLFSTAEQSGGEIFSKLVFPDFSKTYYMLRFLEKYDKLPLRFHFFRGHFPLGRRIFPRPKNIAIYLWDFKILRNYTKIIKFGGTPRKRDYFFSIKGMSDPFFGLPAPSLGSNETPFWIFFSMLPKKFKK